MQITFLYSMELNDSFSQACLLIMEPTFIIVHVKMLLTADRAQCMAVSNLVT